MDTISQSANQPNVKCELSFWSTIFKGIRSNLTYKLTINGETTRITLPKELSKMEAALDSKSATIGKLSISTKEIFSSATDIETINKNFKLATLSSIVSMDDITRYEDIIKSACKGLSAKDLVETFINLINQDESKIENIAKIVSLSSGNDSLETTACILAEYLTLKTNATVVNQQGLDLDFNQMIDLNQVEPHIAFPAQLQQSNTELTKKVFIYLLTSAINKGSSCLLMFDNAWKQNHGLTDLQESQNREFFHITRSINYDHIIYILSTMKQNGIELKDITTKLIQSALSQKKDYFQVGKLIKCAVTNQILSIEDSAKAINEREHPLSSYQKQQILSGITDEELQKQVALKMGIDPETTNQLKQNLKHKFCK